LRERTINEKNIRERMRKSGGKGGGKKGMEKKSRVICAK